MGANAASAPGGYKALVCVFLMGGNDSYNMFVPARGTEYGEYALARTNLAVRRHEVLTVQSNLGSDWGLSPCHAGHARAVRSWALRGAGECGYAGRAYHP
ncbi:MAG: DUF1501 domain-containing protein [Limnobacter sp.]|nr:DUF1501 domain-containing protein [Limnobacter sp.]